MLLNILQHTSVRLSRSRNKEFIHIIMPMKWTNEQVFKLLDLFKERELLWNTILEDHKDRSKKHNAWVEIADDLGVDKQMVQKKMKSLIGQFQRELKKCKLGVEGDEMSKWFAYKKMMFLKNRSKPGNSYSIDIKIEGDSVEEDEESETETAQKNFVNPKFRTYRKKTMLKTKTNKEALNILKRMCGSRPRDEFEVFGEHVAIKLRNLNNSCARHTAQYKINNILYKAAMGKYDWPSRDSPSDHLKTVDTSTDYCTPGPSAVSESSGDETK